MDARRALVSATPLTPTGPRLRRWLRAVALTSLPAPLLRVLRRVHVRRRLARLTAEDEPDWYVVRRLVAPGDTVVDVGAGIGVYSALLARRVGAHGAVLALEPLPESYDALLHAARKLGWTQLTVWRVAVSAAAGWGTLAVPADADGVANHYRARLLADDERDPRALRNVRTPTDTLDALVARWQSACAVRRVRFIKIDTEGHELVGLSSGAELLADARPALLVETGGDAARLEPLVARLARDGYAPYVRAGERVRRRTAADTAINTFFLTPAQRRRLGERG